MMLFVLSSVHFPLLTAQGRKVESNERDVAEKRREVVNENGRVK